MKQVLIFLAVLMTVPTYAQFDAKALGMGGVSMTTIGASHPIYNNPTMGLFSPFPTQISSTYLGQGKADSYALTGSYLIGFDNLAMAGWRQSFYSPGNNTMSLDLGYARRIGSKWAVGAVIRYTHLKYTAMGLSDTNNALVADLSTGYSLPLNNVGAFATLRAGAKLSNLGGFFKAPGVYKLPVSFKAGAALDTFITDAHEITVGADIGYRFTSGPERGFDLNIGAEYNLMQLFQVRAGYFLDNYRSTSYNYGTLGAGVRFIHLRLDFAYLFANKEAPLHNTYSLSFGFDF